jgi:hypothetical protein
VRPKSPDKLPLVLSTRQINDMKWPLSLLLFSVFLCSVYGFLASFEPTEDRMVWRAIYTVVALLSLGGITKIWRASR